jgi:predicted deacylase
MNTFDKIPQVKEPAYPIEISSPDISEFADGNCGIPYLYTFDSGVSGPHVMINALTHGNEICGAIAVKALLKMGLRPRQGKLTLSFANYAAFANFDHKDPDASRFVDQDLNRVWTAERLDDASKNSFELQRAREMRPVIDTVDMLLDVHSMHERSAPLMLSGPLEKGISLAKEMSLPGNVIVDQGHSEGTRLMDYADFGNPDSEKNALLVECGQHWEKSAETIAFHCIGRFLLLTKVVDAEDLPEQWKSKPDENTKVIRVTDAVVASSMNFRFKENYRGLEIFTKKDTVFAYSDEQALSTPYDNCVLVMPSVRQLRPGVTVVRLGSLDQ